MFTQETNEVYNQFSNLFDTDWDDMLNQLKPNNETMKVDGNVFVMRFDVPGFSKKDFKITVEDTTLVIDGTTDERKFFKSYKIESSWDIKNATAEVKNGILTLIISKKKVKKDLVQIPVK